jgi:reactive intermediate/imine deaminase
VRGGDFIYVSGQVPTLEGEVVNGGIISQSEAVIENVISVLKLANCGLEHVIKVNVWLDDPRDFTSFNSVFAKYFTAHPPARSTVQSALMIDAKVEMDVIAYKPE